MYLLLREKPCSEEFRNRLKTDFASSGEMFHAMTWLPKYLVRGYSLAAVVGISSFPRHGLVEGERIAQLAPSWSMRDCRLAALLTPIGML